VISPVDTLSCRHTPCLATIRFPEFAAEQHEGVFEEAALFQIRQQSSRWLICSCCVVGQTFVKIVVVIPAALSNLNKTNASFTESTCQQTLSSKATSRARLHAVGILDMLWLSRNIQQLGNLPLHPKRQFVGLNDAVQFVGGTRLSSQI